jgi:hypothetical protein
MHPDLLDILSRKGLPITNEQLVDYLTGDLTHEERNQLERALAGTAMEDDALEGLQMISQKEKIRQYESDINKALREKLHQKSKKSSHKKPVPITMLMLLTGGVLALIFLVWLVIYLMHKGL